MLTNEQNPKHKLKVKVFDQVAHAEIKMVPLFVPCNRLCQCYTHEYAERDISNKLTSICIIRIGRTWVQTNIHIACGALTQKEARAGTASVPAEATLMLLFRELEPCH